MEVRFSNTDVAVWKLRAGVVVAYETLMHVSYGHISNISNTYGGDFLITLTIGTKSVTLPSKYLLWLEP